MELTWENPERYRHFDRTLVALISDADQGDAIAMLHSHAMHLVTAPDGVQWNAWATKYEPWQPWGEPKHFGRLTFTKTGPPIDA